MNVSIDVVIFHRFVIVVVIFFFVFKFGDKNARSLLNGVERRQRTIAEGKSDVKERWILYARDLHHIPDATRVIVNT